MVLVISECCTRREESMCVNINAAKLLLAVHMIERERDSSASDDERGRERDNLFIVGEFQSRSHRNRNSNVCQAALFNVTIGKDKMKCVLA